MYGLSQRKNIYFGKDSILKLDPLVGKVDKVDTLDDFLAVMYALFIDAFTAPMLTHWENYPYIGVIRFDPKVFSGRVAVLYRLLSTIPKLKKSKYLKSFVNKLADLVTDGRFNEAKQMLEYFARNTGTFDIYSKIFSRIVQTKQRPKVFVK